MRGKEIAGVRALAARGGAEQLIRSELSTLLAYEDDLTVREILLFRGVARAAVARDAAEAAAAARGTLRRAVDWCAGSQADPMVVSPSSLHHSVGPRPTSHISFRDLRPHQN